MDFKNRLHYIYSFIPKTNMKKFPGEFGIIRVKMLLSKLDNPQEKIKVIHIAGTSGKGSTATITAKLLQSHGQKVGLHVKPHMYDIRERFQINGTIISEQLFTKYCDVFFPIVEEISKGEYGKLTYFEVLISLAYYIFYKENVDYAVIETGVGGLYDGSNVIDNPKKLAVITSIGFDHTAILGNTLQEIAAQKAGIIQKNNNVIVLKQDSLVNKVIEKKAEQVSATIKYVEKNKDFVVKDSTIQGSIFDYLGSPQLLNLELSLLGEYQVENAAIAITSFLHVLSRDGIQIDEKAIRTALISLTIPGRFDTQQVQGKKIILDGAHNPQKMHAFLSNLQHYNKNNKWTFLISFKEGKDIEEMLKMIVPVAKKIIITDFFNDEVDFISISEKPEFIAKLIEKEGFNNIEIIHNIAKNFNSIISSIKDDSLVITGSLYLLSDVYQKLRSSKI